MSVFPNWIYRFNTIPIKNELFYEYWQTDSKVYMERQKIQDSQHNIEGEK